MNEVETCWCKELYGLPDEVPCKKFECARYRINIRKLHETEIEEKEKSEEESH